MPQLIIKWGNRETRFSVTTPSVDIGRADDNLLQIKDVKVSRYQCKIVQTPLGYLLSDLESSNGTFLNGKRAERTLLHNNDVLKIGNVEIVFSESDSAQTQNDSPLVISSGPSSDNALMGEETTVINIQEESASPAGKDEKSAQNKPAQVAVVAKVAKRIVENPAPAGLPVQRAMNNQVLQNGAGRPPITPAPQPQPARVVSAKPVSVPPPAPKPAPAAPRPASRISTPASKPAPAVARPASQILTPAPKPPAPVASRPISRIP
ncbi:MAG TPA: FHA domain-containing protein, partial [Planctomycetota bacterium]|nr:FHA domain-containing protein [Planctomycetota bacterium]